MPRKQKAQRDIEQYDHSDKERLNNPPVGLVSEATEPTTAEKKKYEYDPHLDPQLQWAGKAEHTSFEVPTVSLHVHERIDSKTILENARKEETLYDQPLKEKNKVRVTGPFTVEAVPSLCARSLEEIEQENQGTGESVARSGETSRQAGWRDELLKTGVRAKGGGKLEFTRVEPMGGTRWIQCEAETREDNPQKVLIVFGPEHSPLLSHGRSKRRLGKTRQKFEGAN